MINTAVV